MKLLTKEEEREHYNATLKGGAVGGFGGLGLGLAAVYVTSMRYQFMRQLTLPLKAFLITSTGTFGGIIYADHYSRAFEQQRNPKDVEYKERQAERAQQEVSGLTWTQRAMQWGKAERYKIVGASWLASMGAAFAIVNRNKYLTGQQKLVQARVYAQFLTLGVLVASAAFEISDSKNDEGRWETVRYIDPKDPNHKRMLEKKVRSDAGSGSGGEKEDRGGQDLWKDMVAAEEDRIKEHDSHENEYRKQQAKKHPKEQKASGDKKQPKAEKEDEKKDDKKEDKKDEKSKK